MVVVVVTTIAGAFGGVVEVEELGPLGRVVRLKGVLRISEDEWLLAQVSAQGFDLRPSSWRRDSRVEVLLDDPARASDARDWDAAWQRVQQR